MDKKTEENLIINGPVYGDLFDFLEKTQARQFVAPLALVPYRSGYYDPRTGGFSPIPRPKPAPR